MTSIDNSNLRNVSQTIRQFEDLAKAEAAKAARDKARTPAPENKKATPQQLRENVTKELRSTNHSTFVSRSQTAWQQIAQQNPAISDKITAFRNAHTEKMDRLKEKSWNALKREIGTGMAKPQDSDNLSMEQFRQEANSLVDELVAIGCEEMGLPEVTWSASGTAGFNSDVDTAMRAKSGTLTTDQAYTIKFLRDSAHAAVFGGLSGTQLDTESYTPHVALNETRKTLTKPEFKHQFSTTESAMAILQAKVGFQNHREHWIDYCKSQLSNTANPERRTATAYLMKNVEEWHDALHFDVLKATIVENPPASLTSKLPSGYTQKDLIQLVEELSSKDVKLYAAAIQKNDPEAYKRAAINHRTPIMLQLASNTVQLEKRLGELQEKIQHLREHNPEDPQLPGLIHDFEKGSIELDIFAKMLNSLQDEGTFSQSEGNVTLFREGGQIDAGSLNKVRKVFKTEVQKMEEQISQNRTNSHLNINLIREQVKGARATREATTAEELTLAAYEEEAQFEHVIQEGLHKSQNSKDPDKIARDTAINAGKYCLRTTRNKLRAMEQVEKEYKAAGKELPEGFPTLLEAMRSAEFAAQQLEQCKRKFTLNDVASQKLLEEAILQSAEARGATIDPNKLKEEIAFIIKEMKSGGLTDESMPRREKMNEIVKHLKANGFIDEVVVTEASVARTIGDKIQPKDEGIRRVLEGLVGYSRVSLKTDREYLNPLFDRADQITLEHLQLSGVEDVKEFSKQIEGLSHSWQNMAAEMGILPPLANEQWIDQQLNFRQLWNEVKQQSNG